MGENKKNESYPGLILNESLSCFYALQASRTEAADSNRNRLFASEDG